MMKERGSCPSPTWMLSERLRPCTTVVTARAMDRPPPLPAGALVKRRAVGEGCPCSTCMGRMEVSAAGVGAGA